MHHIPFIVACVMLGWDASGHLFAAIARWSGPTGAHYWNTYSAYVWPRIVDPLALDIFWAAWHFTTIGLFILSYFIWGTIGNTAEIQRRCVDGGQQQIKIEVSP